MKRIIVILFLIYYILGSFCLPSGDFSFMVDIPVMYKNCKATEDKNMTPFDFITDHLINFDCLFDKHDKGDEQKPHQPPIKIENTIQQPIFKFELTCDNNVLFQTKEIIFNFVEPKHPLDYNNSIFRPPIV